MKKITLLGLLLIGLTSCSDQKMAKAYGGTATIEIPKDNVVISGSWKDGGNLWVLTRDTVTNEVVYREYSSWGLIEGKIKIKTKSE